MAIWLGATILNVPCYSKSKKSRSLRLITSYSVLTLTTPPNASECQNLLQRQSREAIAKTNLHGETRKTSLCSWAAMVLSKLLIKRTTPWSRMKLPIPIAVVSIGKVRKTIPWLKIVNRTKAQARAVILTGRARMTTLW